jgi:hypothetical protein
MAIQINELQSWVQALFADWGEQSLAANFYASESDFMC